MKAILFAYAHTISGSGAFTQTVDISEVPLVGDRVEIFTSPSKSNIYTVVMRTWKIDYEGAIYVAVRCEPHKSTVAFGAIE